MLTRSIAYLLVDIAAAAIEIYLFFVAIVVATPLMPPLCGRSLLFVILRAHLSFNKTTSKTEEKTHAFNSDDKRRHHSLVLAY